MIEPLPDRTHRHVLDRLVHDPSGLAPLCDQPAFAALIEEMVADEAPRRFAVVQEYGRRVDAQIAAWGMAFPDHAEVVSADGSHRLSLPGPQSAVRPYRFGTHIQAHLIWVDPAPR